MPLDGSIGEVITATIGAVTGGGVVAGVLKFASSRDRSLATQQAAIFERQEKRIGSLEQAHQECTERCERLSIQIGNLTARVKHLEGGGE